MQGTAGADQYAMAMTLGHLLTCGDFCAGQLPADPTDAMAWKDRPDLRTLGLHIPDRLRRVMEKATAFDPNDRYDDVESFKRALDKATPATAFVAATPNKLLSTDGAIEISWEEQPAGHTVEVRIRQRRRNADGKSGLTRAAADRHVRSLVTRYAYQR
jgi:hypothetical protein